MECMRLQGWDMGFWKDHASPFCADFTPDNLQAMAGNMWNAFSFTRIKIAACGCVDWAKAEKLMEEKKTRASFKHQQFNVELNKVGGAQNLSDSESISNMDGTQACGDSD